MATANYNFDLEESELQRRQKVADAMQGSLLAPLEMPTVPGAKVSPLHILTKIMQAYASGQQQDAIKGDRQKMAERYQTELASGMNRFDRTTRGTPGSPEMGPPTAEGAMQPAVPGMPGDPRKAVMDAMASGHPMLQKLGMSRFEAMNKAETPMTVKDLAAYADPASIPGMLKEGAGAFKPKRALREVGGILVDEANMQPIKIGGAQSPETVTINGDLYELNPSTGQRKKLDNAPKITNNTTVNMPKAETEFMKALGKEEGQRVSKQLEARPMQIDGLAAIEKGIKLLDQDIYTGIFSDVQRNVNKVTGALAKQEPAKAARTEQFIAYIGDVVIPRLKDFGGSDTVEELKYLQKVQGGDITMEKSALQGVLKSADEKMRRKIAATDSTIATLKKRGLDLSSFDPGTTPAMPAPLPTTPGPAAVIPFDEYMKRQRGGR